MHRRSTGKPPTCDSPSRVAGSRAPGLSSSHGRVVTATRVIVLRFQPVTLVPLHRRGSEVHAFNLSGSTLLNETGEVVDPGGYVWSASPRKTARKRRQLARGGRRDIVDLEVVVHRLPDRRERPQRLAPISTLDEQRASQSPFRIRRSGGRASSRSRGGFATCGPRSC